MLDCAEAIVEGALPARRAAAPTTATDFPERDDAELAQAHHAPQDLRRPRADEEDRSSITEFQPKERKY